MRTMPGAGKVASCLFGCTSAVDQIEHYLVCPIAWQALQSHSNTTLNQNRRSLQAMLLAEKGLQEREVCAIAMSVYAVARTVMALRNDGNLQPTPLFETVLEPSRLQYCYRHHVADVNCTGFCVRSGCELYCV